MAITKPSVRPAWADAAGPSDTTDPGTAFQLGGWPLSATPPSRQFFNWILNRLDNAVRYFSRRGVADWDAAETYAFADVCMSPNGQIMQSLSAGNINQNPNTQPSWWGPLIAYSTQSYVGSSIVSALLTYATKSYADAAAANAQTAAVNYVIANYVSNPSLASQLTGYVSISSLPGRVAYLAPLDSPLLTGAPRGPTQANTDASTLLATTAFVKNFGAAYINNNSGSVTMSGGLILKWGIDNGSPGGTQVGFPQGGFPTACVFAIGSPYGAAAASYVSTFTKDNVTLVSPISGRVAWLAIGNSA